MSQLIERACQELDQAFSKGLEIGGGQFPEAYDPIIHASIGVINAVIREYGSCWLYSLNSTEYETSRVCDSNTKLYTFCADYVAKDYDEELDNLIKEHRSNYPSIERLKRIDLRVREIDALRLWWA